MYTFIELLFSIQACLEGCLNWILVKIQNPLKYEKLLRRLASFLPSKYKGESSQMVCMLSVVYYLDRDACQLSEKIHLLKCIRYYLTNFVRG